MLFSYVKNTLTEIGLSNVKFFKNHTNSNTFTVDVSQIAKLDHYHYGLLIYGNAGVAQVTPFVFCCSPTETFINLNDTSASATIENKIITITHKTDKFWGGIRMILFA